MHVYGKNQQFRLFNGLKYGQNNPLLPCDPFPFNDEYRYSASELLYLFINDYC